MERYLKKKNAPYVWVYILFCLALYSIFLVFPSGNYDALRSTYLRYEKDALLAVLMPIITLVLTGLVDSATKARLVFWRWHDTLPGHRAFTILAPNDPRIDLDQLTNKLVSLPDSPRDQNTKWYSLYREYSEAPIVKEAHQAFLLARDLCAIAFLFMVLAPLGIGFMCHNIGIALIYFVIMLAQYLVFALVAQNHGKRMVCNVLVEYIANTDNRH